MNKHTCSDKYRSICVAWLYMTLCFNAAAFLLQCMLCHPTCCSLTESLYFSSALISLLFFFLLPAAQRLNRDGWSHDGDTKAEAPPTPLPLQPNSSADYKAKTLHYFSSQTHLKHLLSSTCKYINIYTRIRKTSGHTTL